METKSPIYIPSKGRADICKTAELFLKHGLDFYIIVEPQDYESYQNYFEVHRLLTLPENDKGIAFARNFAIEHSLSLGAKYHWQVDDDIYRFQVRKPNNKYKPINPDIAFSKSEQFLFRYKNVGIAGLKNGAYAFTAEKPYTVNRITAGIILFNTSLPYRYRAYHEDVDITLQILSSAYWCTVTINMYSFITLPIEHTKGGNHDIYKSHGRLGYIQELQRLWPHIPKIAFSYNRPQLNMSNIFSKYPQTLIRK